MFKVHVLRQSLLISIKIRNKFVLFVKKYIKNRLFVELKTFLFTQNTNYMLKSLNWKSDFIKQPMLRAIAHVQDEPQSSTQSNALSNSINVHMFKL